MSCIVFGHDFLSPRTTNFPSASMFCDSGDLAQLLPCLDL